MCSPVLLPNAPIVQHGPDIGRAPDGSIDHARAVKRRTNKRFAELGLRDVVFRAARMKHLARNFVSKGLPRLRLKLLALTILQPMPEIIDRELVFRHGCLPLAA